MLRTVRDKILDIISYLHIAAKWIEETKMTQRNIVVAIVKPKI